jgi:hypothetical protein
MAMEAILVALEAANITHVAHFCAVKEEDGEPMRPNF